MHDFISVERLRAQQQHVGYKSAWEAARNTKLKWPKNNVNKELTKSLDDGV